jgi:hypothetical protein
MMVVRRIQEPLSPAAVLVGYCSLELDPEVVWLDLQRWRTFSMGPPLPPSLEEAANPIMRFEARHLIPPEAPLGSMDGAAHVVVLQDGGPAPENLPGWEPAAASASTTFDGWRWAWPLHKRPLTNMSTCLHAGMLACRPGRTEPQPGAQLT